MILVGQRATAHICGLPLGNGIVVAAEGNLFRFRPDVPATDNTDGYVLYEEEIVPVEDKGGTRSCPGLVLAVAERVE
jgi:hypothetical protein